jgi:hypothetical protein
MQDHLPRPSMQTPGHRIFHLRLDSSLRAGQAPLVELMKSWYLRRGAGGLPPRSAFDAQALKAFLPHIFISEYETATRRYRFRLIGTAVTEAFRRNATGCYFDDIYCTPDLHELRDMHDAARLSGEPKTISGRMIPAGRTAMKVEALLLPVGVAEGQNPQLLGAMYFSTPDAAFAGPADEIAAYSMA